MAILITASGLMPPQSGPIGPQNLLPTVDLGQNHSSAVQSSGRAFAPPLGTAQPSSDLPHTTTSRPTIIMPGVVLTSLLELYPTVPALQATQVAISSLLPSAPTSVGTINHNDHL
ncbi:hypothetical protein Fot_14701 [Forsythia ovata]|uniref:Uncharacterized protein n=1 Tax=Forsythia ovata TaxID=205694 RepID=A0ABD1W9G8_9LAMI